MCLIVFFIGCAFVFVFCLCVCHFVFDDAKVYIIFGLCKKIEEYFGTFLSTPYYKSRVRMRIDVFSPFLCVFFKVG